MREKIVYLLGAGASYHAIPVVSGMSTRLTAFLDFFKHNRHLMPEMDAAFCDSLGETKIFELIPDLFKEINESYSIDTVARKLYLQGNKVKLDLIKGLISAFITWEQIVIKSDRVKFHTRSPRNTFYTPSTNYVNDNWRGTFEESDALYNSERRLRNFDYRYESLLSVIAPRRNVLNPNVSFVSWNYDNQLEIAIDRVFNLEGSEKEINQLTDRILGNNFIKLNGSCGDSNFDWEPVIRYNQNKKELLLLIADFLFGKINSFPNRITFAWENEREIRRAEALQLFKNASIIVIIGYSFPDYNRKIDYQLLTAFWSQTAAKPIVVQDTPENADKVVQRIRSMSRSSSQSEKITAYTDVHQFYIPSNYLT
jgi:hypothetical protein